MEEGSGELKRLEVKPGTMSPMERQYAVTNGLKYDRVRTTLFLDDIRAKFIGKDVINLYRSVSDMVEAETLIFNRYNQDGISLGFNSVGIAEAMGAEPIYQKKGPPLIDKVVIEDYRMLDSMDTVDPMKDGYLPVQLEAVGTMKNISEGIVDLGSSVGGTLTIAAFLRGTENLMRDFRKNPEEVRKLLDIVLQSQKACVDCLADLGVSIGMADPVSSGSLLSEKLFTEFALPYIKDLTDYIYFKTGQKPGFHMCGKTEKFWKYFNDLNISAFSLDNRSSIREAMEVMGKDMTILGNVPPVEVMMNGNREDINKAVKHCTEEGSLNPRGYILGFGCDLPYETSEENINSYMDAAAYNGSYERMEKNTGKGSL